MRFERAKVRISEQKTKENFVFLCFFERKCLNRGLKVQRKVKNEE